MSEIFNYFSNIKKDNKNCENFWKDFNKCLVIKENNKVY